jgi:hypothetical protein
MFKQKKILTKIYLIHFKGRGKLQLMLSFNEHLDN